MTAGAGDVVPGPQEGLGANSGPRVDAGTGKPLRRPEDVVATAECGGCAKPLALRCIHRWEHADGNTYRHRIEPYFVEATGTAAEARLAAVLAYLDRCETDDSANFTTVEVRRLLTGEASNG